MGFEPMIDRELMIDREPMIDRELMIDREPMIDRELMIDRQPMIDKLLKTGYTLLFVHTLMNEKRLVRGKILAEKHFAPLR